MITSHGVTVTFMKVGIVKAIFVFMARHSLVGLGLLIAKDRQSYSDTPLSAGLLWMSDQPDAETSTLTTHNSHKRRISMPPA
jgi:hypothetical protein